MIRSSGPAIYIKLFFTFVTLIIIVYSCANQAVETKVEINLRYIKGFEGESIENVKKGLAWNFSFLGASLPKGSMAEAVTWIDESNFKLNLSRLGFSDHALSALKGLIEQMKASEEYRVKGGLDLGRFISLSLLSSNHYYKITGVPNSYTEFRKGFLFDDSRAAIVESGVAKGNRIIEIARGNTFRDVAFIALEGTGSLTDGTFRQSEHEVFDFMANGQLRFAIYDSLGNLKSGGTPSLTSAGKPAKCLWCHETGIHLPFGKTSVSGYYSLEEFATIVSEKMKIINQYRQTLSIDIDYNQRQDHTQAELLYLTFMEPKVERLALEWGLTVDSVKSRLHDFKPHKQSEFSYLGEEVYWRHEIDDFAPYKHLRVPADSREISSFEPDYLIHEKK